MRIAVTGSQGFLGRHVMAELWRRDFTPIGLDLPEWDASNPDSTLPSCLKVIHLAGVLGTSELFDNARHAVDVNVGGALHVLEECQRIGAGYVGITMPSVWANVYQATKGCARALASAWHANYRVPVSHVRAFNVFGFGQKLDPVQKLVPTFSHRAYRGEPLPVWGDGTQQTDQVWVGDVARMLVDALAFDDDQVFDAGTGEGHSVLDLAGLICHIAQSDSPLEFKPMRPGEQTAKVIAEGEGWDLLGWRPEWDILRFEETVRSYK